MIKSFFNPNKSKYKNKSCRCLQGHIHRSRFEAQVCNNLHFEYKESIKKGLCKIETEKRFDMIVSDIKICSHYVDFLIVFKNGDKIAVEAKGFATPVWKIKKKLFEALYSDI